MLNMIVCGSIVGGNATSTMNQHDSNLESCGGGTQLDGGNGSGADGTLNTAGNEKDGEKGEAIPDWMSQWTNRHRQQHQQDSNPRIGVSHDKGLVATKRQSWYSAGGAPSASPTTTITMDLDDDDDDDDTDSLVEVGVTRPSEEWESMLLDDHDRLHGPLGSSRFRANGTYSNASSSNDDDDDDEMMSCRSDLDDPNAPPIPIMIDSAAVTGLDEPTPLHSSSWHQRSFTHGNDAEGDEYVDVIMQLDDDEGLLSTGIVLSMDISNKIYENDDDLMMASHKDEAGNCAATTPPPPLPSESLYDHLDAYSMDDGFLFLDSHQSEEMMTAMTSSVRVDHGAALGSYSFPNSTSVPPPAPQMPKPPPTSQMSGRGTKKATEKKKAPPRPKKRVTPKTASTSHNSSLTTTSKKSSAKAPGSGSKGSSIVKSKAPTSKPLKKSTTRASVPKKSTASHKTCSHAQTTGSAAPRPSAPIRSTSSSSPKSPPRNHPAAPQAAAMRDSGSERIAAGDGSSGMDERVFHETLQKLSNSMKRSKETRKSLTMTTPKVTDEYARRASVSKVLTSIEWSSRQVDTYMQSIQQRTTTL